MRKYVLGYYCASKAIATSGGKLRAPFQKIAGTNILVLIDESVAGDKRYPAGTVFVPNRQLAEDSGDKVTHMAYTGGLYEAFRGGTHTVRRGGALPPPSPEDTSPCDEIHELQDDIATARTYVGALIASGMLTPDEEKTLKIEQRRLAERYGAKRNAFKKKARGQMERGLNTQDSRGRRNPSAAAFASGGAIRNLLARQEQVRMIGSAVDRRTIHLYYAIEKHMELFQGLRAELKPGNLPGTLEALLRPACGARSFFRAANILRELSLAFALVRALPFRTNAVLTEHGLLRAAECADRKDREGTLALYKIIRRGIAWTFALHTLENTVLAPLSYLIEEHRGKIVYAVAPARLSRIIAALHDFSGRLALCSDAWPKYPRKNAVAAYIQTAEQCIAVDDWLKAKEALRSASALM